MPLRSDLEPDRIDATGLDRRAVAFGAAALLVRPAERAGGAQEPGFTAELITITSRGKPIRAVVFRPVANARGSGIVYLHGSGSIGPNQLRFAQSFARQGYVAVVPTYLDAAADDSIRAAPIMNAWRDCGIDAVEWLISQGIEPRRTASIGYSLGSFIATDGALGGGRAGAAIAIAGGWDVYVPRPPARRIPVLMVRAERDTHVRPPGTERWRQFLTERGVSVRMRVIRGAGHIMNQRQWDEVSRHALEFLNDGIGHLDAPTTTGGTL
ncbi:MAG: dienelactone hydrolase family protein [Alphaproteobacteria bacterium]|nr:dienelactone hydrolase family protein [Alphaproteobacteria bacterium]